MLAQSYKSAADLGITEPQLSALIKTLVLLETGRLKHEQIGDGWYPNKGPFTGQFNMVHWNSVHDCGTIACIGGTAELIGGVSFGAQFRTNINLYRLFLPTLPEEQWDGITTDQAAIALRSYLTTGDARWDLAVKS